MCWFGMLACLSHNIHCQYFITLGTMTTAAVVSRRRPRDVPAPGPKSRLTVDQGWKWLAMHDGPLRK